MNVGTIPPQRSFESPEEDKNRYDVLYKIVIIGDTSVGKSNLLAQFTSEDGIAFDPNLRPTVGAEFGTKNLTHSDGTKIRVRIWDTAGQERYRSITKSHYRRAAGAIVLYDVTNPKSLHSAKNYWIREVRDAAERETTLDSCIMFIGNKIDLISAVSEKQHLATAKEIGAPMQGMTSAKTGQNVTKIFEELVFTIYETELRNGTVVKKDTIALRDSEFQSKDQGGCC
mmetsp:Transcript_4753/g.6521  ORF Transcript_4753/g.6521 Transcript_4753/m.6521 type:complete len:227 (+) Transcript_4753:84-764(+)|eukprot:CAMPEP_0117760272 /NCGR_PEP_ID=MMETSP0947-20121206/16526_1 /TAXON_ID=44440 /ORGANISM="Chattonella subsalsa, Strain CCMP2191" /LENGTH=226 /DNA_ID=CAMNT_0005580921 /DNA_START=229 /DNA_END=909 /DNA_ORIENTATION=-